jgi:hypothetical protein
MAFYLSLSVLPFPEMPKLPAVSLQAPKALPFAVVPSPLLLQEPLYKVLPGAQR